MSTQSAKQSGVARSRPIAFDQDNKVALSTGTLLLIDNAIDPTTATIRLKAMFANVDDALWPGEFVNARVLVETRHGATIIPNAAIQNGPQGLFAWVVAADDTVQPRPIEVGPDTGDLTIVTAGLADGDCVVTAGQYKLRLPKTKVVITDRRTGYCRANGSQVNISEPFIRRPVATSLLMAAVALVGIAAFLRLPVAPLPQVDFPTVQVTATLAGASAETMASSVATPLERQLGQIPGVTEMTSFSGKMVPPRSRFSSTSTAT